MNYCLVAGRREPIGNMPPKRVSTTDRPQSKTKPEVTRSFIKKRKFLGPDAPLTEIQKKNAEQTKWTLQYWQEKSFSELSGIVCGTCTFSL